jgi:predicted acylesterase/phospholipase RssA
MRLINGVFMGGGAKSIAYAGALKATHDRDLWFGGVAGASAGAIVASLIASGMQPEALENAIPDGLAAVRSNKFVRLGKAVIGNATSVFEGRGLREWLDRTLAGQIGATGERPVTFADLHRSTRIELYVVAMDLATGLPVVFCRRTTPNVEVAGAVAASAAIPGAFPAGRAVFDAHGEGAVVHQLVDGSSWANYPAFIFQDRSFRTWLQGEAQAGSTWSDEDRADWIAEGERPVVGYVLGDPEPLEQRNSIGFVPLDGPDVNRRFDQGPTYTSPKRVTYLFGALLSSDWARLVIGIALLIWVTLSVVVLPVAFRRFSTWLALWMPDFLYPIALVGALAVVVVAMLVAIVAIGGLILVGRLVADTLLPSVKAVLGVPLEVAPWIGLGDDSVVIRVPDDALSTVNFDVDPEVRAAAIEVAHDGASRQFDSGTSDLSSRSAHGRSCRRVGSCLDRRGGRTRRGGMRPGGSCVVGGELCRRRRHRAHRDRRAPVAHRRGGGGMVRRRTVSTQGSGTRRVWSWIAPATPGANIVAGDPHRTRSRHWRGRAVGRGNEPSLRRHVRVGGRECERVAG